jgi:ubiquitin C-terminal hydrolase
MKLENDDQSESANKNRYNYDLRSVVVHIGRPESGHFVCYRRGWTPGVGTNNRRASWFYISDAEVKKVSFDEVANSEAYMLFYERTGRTQF